MATASQLVFKKVVWALRTFEVKSLISGKASLQEYITELQNKQKTKIGEVKYFLDLWS